MPRTTSLAALALPLLLASHVAAMTVLPLDLPELTERADRIFVGRVERVESGRDAHGLPATWTTFAVVEKLKGAPPEHVTLKQLGASLGAGTTVVPHPALPRYRPGESVVLFVHPDSGLGFTSPVGLGQGCFRLRTADGGTVAENDVGNRNLAPAPGASRQRPAASPRTATAVAPPNAAAPLALDDLLVRVRALVAATP